MDKKNPLCFYTGDFCHLIELFPISPGSLRLLAALNAGTLVMLTLTNLGQHTRLGTAALKTLQRVVQGLALFDMDLRHCISPPSEAAVS